MNKIIKAVILLAIATVLVFGAIWFENKRQKPSPPLEPTTRINTKIVYSENTGSIPPPYYSETIVTVYTNQQGTAYGSVVVQGYDDEDVKSKKDFSVSKKQFSDLYKAVKNVENTESDLGGCTGGRSSSLIFSEGDVIDKEVYSYTCGGEDSNPSLSIFAKELKKILQIII